MLITIGILLISIVTAQVITTKTEQKQTDDMLIKMEYENDKLKKIEAMGQGITLEDSLREWDSFDKELKDGVKK